MFLTGSEPDYIPRTDRLDWAAPNSRKAAAGRDYKCLAERVRMPCRASAGLESNVSAAYSWRITCLKQRINADDSSKPIFWALTRGL
jgi:hypothetical protein